MTKRRDRREPYMRFFGPDWRSDIPLRRCSYAARGLWIDMLTIMHDAEPYGELRDAGQPLGVSDLVQLLGGSPAEIKRLITELESRSVFSRCSDGAIFSRRMKRDYAKSEENKTAGNGGGNPEIRRGTVPKEERLRRFRASDNPAKANRIFEKDGGNCHWCHKVLQRDAPGHDRFHIDHVKAICDGGGNEDANLVAACAECNHKRARKGWSDPNHPDASDPNLPAVPDPNTDPKAHGTCAPDHFHFQSKKDSSLTEEESLSRARDPSEPPVTDPIGPKAAELAVNSVVKALKPTAYPPGRKAVRSPADMVEELAPPRSRAAHLTPEQLAIARARRIA